MAKANPVTGSTVYVGSGHGVAEDLPPGVRGVGPGAEVPEPEEAAEVMRALLAEPEAEPDPTPAPPRPVSKPRSSSPASSAPADEG